MVFHPAVKFDMSVGDSDKWSLTLCCCVPLGHPFQHSAI